MKDLLKSLIRRLLHRHLIQLNYYHSLAGEVEEGNQLLNKNFRERVVSYILKGWLEEEAAMLKMPEDLRKY